MAQAIVFGLWLAHKFMVCYIFKHCPDETKKKDGQEVIVEKLGERQGQGEHQPEGAGHARC